MVRRAGWRRRAADGRFQYLIEPEVWRELCAESGVDAAETGRTLLRLNLMRSGDGKKVTCSVRVPDVGKTRAYVVSEDMLGDAES